MVARAEQRAEAANLPTAVLDQIVAKTDGVPLFVEELTRAVLETNLLHDEGDHYALAGPLPPMAIPTTLQESLLARLDRLAPAHEVAQVAAAIGREFSHELLAMTTALPESELQAALHDLVGAGLVFRHGTPPQATYSFKHALVQDAAYATLVARSGSASTPGSPPRSSSIFRRRCRRSPNFWPTITGRRGWPNRRSTIG